MRIKIPADDTGSADFTAIPAEALPHVRRVTKDADGWLAVIDAAGYAATRAGTPRNADQAATRKSLDEQLVTWLKQDRDYLKADDATQAADMQSQVVRLTRQCKNLIKLAIDDLDSED